MADARHLRFAFESTTNNKICKSCYLKNYKALKHSRDEQGIEHASRTKKVKEIDNDVGENVNVEDFEVQEKADTTEKEGTAISVLFHLSLL